MEQPSLETIRRSIRREFERLQGDYGVVSLWVVGSRAKGNARADSDLDMLVELDGRPMGLLRFVDLERELSEISKLRVDLGEKEALRKELRDEVLSSAVLVWRCQAELGYDRLVPDRQPHCLGPSPNL